MICSSVNQLFFMYAILLADVIHYLYVGAAGRGRLNLAALLIFSM